MNRKLPRLLVAAIVGLMLTAPLSATTVLIDAINDNTLYESPMGLLSNGSGNHLFIGRTSGQEKRRALLASAAALRFPDADSSHFHDPLVAPVATPRGLQRREPRGCNRIGAGLAGSGRDHRQG